jgi:ParB-like nuclease domain
MPATQIPATPKKSTQEFAKRLRKSPLQGVQPLTNNVQWIDIDKLDVDPTNPGSSDISDRYRRREQPIRESYDILGRIVYPLVVCTKDDGPGRFWLVDGHGRFAEAKARGEKKVACIVFPSLTLQQRIILRQVLNAAQEPFDPPLILRDLYKLAEERNLDIRNSDEDLDELLADFPAVFANEKSKLRVLSEWPEDVAHKISIDVNKKDDMDEPGVIGYRKIHQLNVLLKKVRKQHPVIAGHYPGEKLNRQLLRLYFDGVFKDGGRSQDGIEKANKVIREADDNEPLIGDFLKGSLKVGEFASKAEQKQQEKEASESPLVRLCKELKVKLNNIYPPELSRKEYYQLKSTRDVIEQALEEIAAAKNYAND